MPFVPGVGILIEQDPLVGETVEEQLEEIRARHVAAIAEANAYLATTDMDPWEIVEQNITSAKVRKCWWHEEAGGVYPEYPGAKLMLFVEVPIPEAT